jgi:hypothetical protein
LLVVLTIALPSASSGSRVWVRKYGPLSNTRINLSRSSSNVSWNIDIWPKPASLTGVERVAIPVVANRGNDGVAKRRERLAAADVDR